MRALILTLSVLATAAYAQTARQAVISFAAPTKYTDGSSIPASVAISYNVYQGAKGAVKPKVATITATSTTINTGLAAGETCWQVSSVANGVESALSNEACKSFPFPATDPVTITVT
jgi:hypothetical protein